MSVAAAAQASALAEVFRGIATHMERAETLLENCDIAGGVRAVQSALDELEGTRHAGESVSAKLDFLMLRVADAHALRARGSGDLTSHGVPDGAPQDYTQGWPIDGADFGDPDDPELVRLWGLSGAAPQSALLYRRVRHFCRSRQVASPS